MQVTETLNEGLKRGYQIVLTAAELEDKVNEKLAEAQPDVEMKGFRKDDEKAVRTARHGRSDAGKHRRRDEQAL